MSGELVLKASQRQSKNLKTRDIGRLVIYSDIITSTMDVVAGLRLHHGLVVISRQQSQGHGRSKNLWLSPMGCAMFTLQLHVPLNSSLGCRISLIQCISVVACVHAIKSLPGYESLDLKIKWPNDIYAGNSTKIGGLLVASIVEGTTIIVNAGLGINLSNDSPTTCINDLIEKHNKAKGTNLQKFSLERFLALVFTELESWLNKIQHSEMSPFCDLYYQYWMHNDASVTVIMKDGTSQKVQIQGIDDFGFLKVKSASGKEFTVHPDGNSFDVLKGLIAPNN